jgi:dihydroorotate dehydrogenase (fumarate)
MSLATTYLGLKLGSPLIVGSGPLSDDLDTVRRLEDAGAAAFVLRPLHEEQVTGEQMSAFFDSESHADSCAEATSFAPDPELAFGPDEYLEHLRRVKAAVRVPVLAALDGATPGGWTSCARLIQDAGADGLQLELYHAQSDPAQSAAEVERSMVEIVRDVKRGLKIPVAVKLSPLFTAFAHFARQIDAAGADGLTLFTRFHRVDIDVVELEVIRRLPQSSDADLSLGLRGLAALSGRVKASLCASGGVHTPLDVIKATMTGAHAVQIVSVLQVHGPGQLRSLRAGIDAWLRENDWGALADLRGNLGADRVPDPAAFERAAFRMMQ